MEHGPVDVIILALGEPRFDGSVLGELEEQASKGIIRVLDAMVVVKGEDGAVARWILRTSPPRSRKLWASSRQGRAVCSTQLMPIRSSREWWQDRP